jgi:hypothetical protein
MTSMPLTTFPKPKLPITSISTSQAYPITSIGIPAIDSEEDRRREGEGEGQGYKILENYIERCLPSKKETETGEESKEEDWLAVQAAVTPTLLPSLRFHDLVFGHELGRGSFGTVRYARQILKDRSRSEWPEYAVKVG